MKIRHPTIIKWIGFLGAVLIRWWIGTLSVRLLTPENKKLYPFLNETDQRYLYAVWHESILVGCGIFASRDVRVLISQSADGEMIARISEHLGFRTIRGSTTLGGMRAMRSMIRAASDSHIAVAPDGPVGPRHRVGLGLVYLAAKTGVPIVVVGVGYRSAWRLNTWDRFAIPLPFSRTVLVALEPILIPEDAKKEEMEAYRQFIEDSLIRATEAAQRLASR